MSLELLSSFIVELYNDLGTTHKGLNETATDQTYEEAVETRKYSSGKKATLKNKVDFYFTLVVY